MSAPAGPASVTTIQAVLAGMLFQPAVEVPLPLRQGVSVNDPGRWAWLALGQVNVFARLCAELEREMNIRPWTVTRLMPCHERHTTELQEIYCDALTLRAELENRKTYG